jgi:hypothetical protein
MRAAFVLDIYCFLELNMLCDLFWMLTVFFFVGEGADSSERTVRHRAGALVCRPRPPGTLIGTLNPKPETHEPRRTAGSPEPGAIRNPKP